MNSALALAVEEIAERHVNREQNLPRKIPSFPQKLTYWEDLPEGWETTFSEKMTAANLRL